MQVVVDIYPHAHIMHRFSTRESRSKSKTNIIPNYSARPRSLSALSLSLIQPSQIRARASSVVRKALGARSPLKGSALLDTPTERTSCDKPRTSADSTPRAGSRPRSNTTPTAVTWPKDVTPSVNHDTLPASPCTSGPTPTIPINSLLFSPTPSTPPSDEQEMDAAQSSPKRPNMTQGSPEIDSGYASGRSSAAGSALPPTNNSPVITRTPRSLGRIAGAPLTPGGLNMRLSPSLPRSSMPMPILNLPPLPPTPVHDHTLPRARSFQPQEMRHVKKTMPALMRHGTSNMVVTHAEEDDDDDDDGSTDSSDSDSSDAEGATPDEGSSPEAQDSVDDSIDESVEESVFHSGSEDAPYFDARETHTPASSDDPSGLATPRASDQHRTLGEASALGLQITPTPGPSTISGSSPWTVVDITPGVDRAASGHPPRSDYFSHPVASARQALKSPHRTPRVSQLISLASPRVNGKSPRAAPAPLSPPNTIAARRARAATVLRDPNGESPRPALYQQVSQSMMNLTSPPPSEGMILTGLDVIRSPCERTGNNPATPGTPVPPMLTPLVRRASMPTLIRHPPNYDDLYPSVPREEEGMEKLPGYSCGIHIEAMMPRKMEFSAPGVLAKDRSWKKQYIVIHGTSMMVYKNDIRRVPIGGKVKGKEKYEGVVTEDEVDLDLPTVHLPGHEPAAPRVPLNPPSRRASTRAASTGASENGSRSSLLSRFHGNSSRSNVPQQQETPAPGDKASASDSTVSISASTSGSASSSTRRWSHNQAPFASSLPHFNPPFSSGNQLIRQYTLQRAECGLGSDYYKRRNVIRVRCEGEQFLLQADSVMQVVDWIECIQAGTNAALDLDERPMTKPPPFPRRRRRRRARPADASNEANGTGANNNTSNDNNTNR